jgi:hypothetical protein
MARDEEINEDNDYVTKSDLRSMLEEIMNGKGGGDESDDGREVINDSIDDGWEIVEEIGDNIRGAFSGDEDDERVSSSDIERIAEQKVQEALRRLAGVKKSAPKKPAPKKDKPEPEVEPTTKKASFGSRLWGEK